MSAEEMAPFLDPPPLGRRIRRYMCLCLCEQHGKEVEYCTLPMADALLDASCYSSTGASSCSGYVNCIRLRHSLAASGPSSSEATLFAAAAGTEH